jgi:hypothetical protein
MPFVTVYLLTPRAAQTEQRLLSDSTNTECAVAFYRLQASRLQFCGAAGTNGGSRTCGLLLTPPQRVPRLNFWKVFAGHFRASMRSIQKVIAVSVPRPSEEGSGPFR